MSKISEFVLTPIIQFFAKNGAMKNSVTKLAAYAKTNPKKVAMALVLSQVAKDAFGCFFYVNQSLNNKEIPKEKRKFVAALDLSNGILMMASQFTLGKLLVSDKFKNFIDLKVIDKIIKNPTIQAQSKKISAILLPLVGSAIIAKRVIVPLIATPVASVFKKKLFDKDEKTPQLQIPEETEVIKQKLAQSPYAYSRKMYNNPYRSTDMSV